MVFVVLSVGVTGNSRDTKLTVQGKLLLLSGNILQNCSMSQHNLAVFFES